MAKLPTYDAPQVAPQAGPSGAMDIQAPNLLSPLAEAAASSISAIHKANRESDALRVTDALTPLEEDVTNIVIRARNVQGRQVVDPEAYGGDQGASLTETMLADFDKAVSSRSEGLTEQQKAMFQAAAQRKRQEIQRVVQSHEAQQMGVMWDQIYKDWDEVLADGISKMGVRGGLPDGEVIRAGLADRVDNARRWASSKGLDPDLAEQAAKSDTHGAVIRGLRAAGNPIAALAYYSDHKMDLDEKTRDAYGPVLEKQAAGAKAQSMADLIESENAQDPDKRARELAGKDDELLGRLRHELAVRKSVAKEKVNEVQGTFLAMYSGIGVQRTSRADIEKMPGYMNMSNKDRVELDRMMDQEDARSKQKESPEDTINRFITFQNIMDNPAALRDMSDNAIVSLGLGEQLTKQLIVNKRRVGGELAKLEHVTMQPADYNAVLDEYGIDRKTKDKKKLAELGAMRSEFERRVTKIQGKEKRILSDEELKSELAAMLKPVVTAKEGGHFGIWDSTDKTQLWKVQSFMDIKATPEERELAALRLVAAGADMSAENFNTILEDIRTRRINPVAELARIKSSAKKGAK